LPAQDELIALIADPSESLSIEHKGWLDLADRRSQAALAKAAIALANHGGGIVIIGMRGDDAESDLQSHARPASITRYNQDDVNAAINRFADPQLHCTLQFSVHPDSGVEHAFVIVPSGERVPVMSRRGTDGIIDAQRCYIRKPGPRSEEPFTGVEWRGLFDRCVRAGREELLEAIRLIVDGRAGEPAALESVERLAAFADQARERWHALLDPLPADDAARMAHGHYEIGFEIKGLPQLGSLTDLRRRLDLAGQLRHTGWGPFVSLHRDPLAPRVIDGLIEAWVGAPDAERFQRDSAHCDFWRVNRDSQFFLLRGYDEDASDRAQPGRAFDATLPVWRIGEAMLFVARFARTREENPPITVRCRYVGLTGRTLTSLSGRRAFFGDRRATDDEVLLTAQATAEEFEDNLAEVLHPMLVPLFERFDFFELSSALVAEELAEMRSNRF
jgi:hypothetical protein